MGEEIGWELIGFSNNIIENGKLDIKNIYLNNPPDTIYDDLKKKYKDIVKEKRTKYKGISLDILKKMSTTFDDKIIGQKHIMKNILPSLNSLNSSSRNRPVSFLFLGESGIGKTETAKYVGENLGGNIVRVQFSMQQTNEAHKFIFGADHGEDSLARQLIRRETNVILLDEFDKVHPSLYNAFYQMFDEGEFVDKNYTVDVRKCIIICTTNYLETDKAEKELGAPIFSRFSKIIKFIQLNNTDKIFIANKIYDKLYRKLKKTDGELIKDNNILDFYIAAINNGSYNNIRMLSNDIEEALNFEILVAKGVLSK